MSRIHEALLRAEQERTNKNDGSVMPLSIAEAIASDSDLIAAPELETASHQAQPNTLVDIGPFQSYAWKPDKDRMVFLEPDRHAVEVEVFRTLRSKLYSERSRRHLKTILVTSASAGEGKSFVAANLAFAIAHQQSETILLVDADQRRPVLHESLGAGNVVGLSEYLLGECDLRAVVQRWQESALHFVPAGRRTSKPAELLTSARMLLFLEEARHKFDWIILDSPPYTAVSDGIALSEQSDGVLIVIGNGAAVDATQRLIKELREKPILGAVLNRAELRRNEYRYSVYGKQGRR